MFKQMRLGDYEASSHNLSHSTGSVVSAKHCYSGKTWRRNNAANRTANNSIFAAFDVEEFGHTKLLSGSVPLELNFTKLTFAVVT